jgi:hypothetical protein
MEKHAAFAELDMPTWPPKSTTHHCRPRHSGGDIHPPLRAPLQRQRDQNDRNGCQRKPAEQKLRYSMDFWHWVLAFAPAFYRPEQQTVKAIP